MPCIFHDKPCVFFGNIFFLKNDRVGFIGPNGAGKSTTIRSCLNLINKTSGTVLFEGEELKKDDVHLKELIGYLPSEINLYEDLTVRKMLDYHESFCLQYYHTLF